MYSAFGLNLSRLPNYIQNRFTKSAIKRTEIILRKMSQADGERETDGQTNKQH